MRRARGGEGAKRAPRRLPAHWDTRQSLGACGERGRAHTAARRRGSASRRAAGAVRRPGGHRGEGGGARGGRPAGAPGGHGQVPARRLREGAGGAGCLGAAAGPRSLTDRGQVGGGGSPGGRRAGLRVPPHDGGLPHAGLPGHHDFHQQRRLPPTPLPQPRHGGRRVPAGAGRGPQRRGPPRCEGAGAAPARGVCVWGGGRPAAGPGGRGRGPPPSPPAPAGRPPQPAPHRWGGPHGAPDAAVECRAKGERSRLFTPVFKGKASVCGFFAVRRNVAVVTPAKILRACYSKYETGQALSYLIPVVAKEIKTATKTADVR